MKSLNRITQSRETWVSDHLGDWREPVSVEIGRSRPQRRASSGAHIIRSGSSLPEALLGVNVVMSARRLAAGRQGAHPRS